MSQRRRVLQWFCVALSVWLMTLVATRFEVTLDGERTTLLGIGDVVARHYGARDYEIVVANRFLDEYRRYRRAFNGSRLRAPSIVERRLRRLVPWLAFAANDRLAYYNDELFHPEPYLPNGSVYIEGVVLASRTPAMCARYECIAVTVAAMSTLLHSAPLHLDQPLNSDVTGWLARPLDVSFLFTHLRPQRVLFRDELLALRANVSVPELHGTERRSSRIYDEAIGLHRRARFAMAFESSRHEHYVTEKIVNAFAAGAIPIYYGSPAIERWFNRRAMIDVSQFPTLADAAAYVLTVADNVSLAASYLRQPPCLPHHLRQLFWWRYDNASNDIKF
jgi:hypothetical protein